MVIKSVEHMALRKTMKELKIKNRKKVIYHPTNWITGVEYKKMTTNKTTQAFQKPRLVTKIQATMKTRV